MQKNVRYATNIDWDTDGDAELKASLPQEIRIPDDVPNDEIEGYISDQTGFCHFGFSVDIREEKED